MQIKPSSDPFFRHRNQYILGQKKRRRSQLFLWVVLFLVALSAAAYYGYQWLNFTQFDLQSLMAQFKAQQATPKDEEKARLEDPQDISRQVLKPSSPDQASVSIPNLDDTANENTATIQTDEQGLPAETTLSTVNTEVETKNLENPDVAQEKAITPPTIEDTQHTTIIVDETLLANLQKTKEAEQTAATDAIVATKKAEELSSSVAPDVVEAVEKQAEPAMPAPENEPVQEQEVMAIAPVPKLSTQTNTDADEAKLQAEHIKALQQQATQQIEAQELDSALISYQELEGLDPKLASPILDAIFLAYQETVENHLMAKDLKQALNVYTTMQQQDAEHISVSAALNAIMEYHQTQANVLIRQQKLQSGNSSALALYQDIQQFAPNHPITQNLQAELLQALLALADKQIKAQKYTTPKNNNAFDTYQAALELVPDHVGASEGLRNLAEKYVQMANKHLDNKKLQSAKNAVNRGEKVLPKYPAWKKLREKIQQVQNLSNPKAELISRAKEQLKVGQLTRPSGDNAYETFQQLQAQFPDDPYGKSGIYTIADRYVELAEEQRQAGQLQNSMALINEGLALVPNHANLQKLKREVLANY